MSMQKVAEELSQQGLIFYDPEQNEWAIAEEYLSGNVKAKLIAAKSATNLPDWIASTIPRNVEALTKVQPLPCVPPANPAIKAACAQAMGIIEITPELLDNVISVRLGTNWLEPNILKQFVVELLKVQDDQITVDYQPQVNQWDIGGSYIAQNSEINRTVWGTEYIYAIEIIEHALNLKEIKIYNGTGDDRVFNLEATELARAKMEEISEHFKQWIWQDEQRAIALTKIYNDRFNNLVDRHYNGSHLELPGSNPEITLNPHQKNGAWRILQSKTVLLPYKVGYGKTFTMAAGAMELRRLKLAHKPMLVALNSTVGQIGAEFKRLYPNAKLLVADKESFAKHEREKFIAKIAMHDWDCVIIAHSQFFHIKVSEEAEREFLSKEMCAIAEAMEGVKCRGLQKALERRKRNLQDKISQVTESRCKDDCVDWEKLGIDALFIDESQFFKNLSYQTRMHNVAGLPNSHAQRSMDTFMKVRHVLSDGGRVIFSTGTPVSNSVAELFTMQRYLDLDYLEKIGLQHFDAWAAQFGETVTAPEITPTGSFKSKTRFARFCNLPELMRLYSRFADFPKHEIKLKLPDLQTLEVAAPASDDQNSFLEVLAYRADQIQRRLVEPEDDNMLKVTSDGRKAALEIRLVNPDADNFAESKVNQCAWNAWQIWKLSRSDKSTQLIFCDFSTPHQERHNVYRYLKDLFVGLGIPKTEVALIHDCKNDADRSRLFEKVRAGNVRILIGSTEKLGTGVNVQDRLLAEHHLDAPWRPSDVEQRTGRTRRQGNKYAKVWSFRYVTEGNNSQAGFDAFLWQTLETKAKFIAQVSNGNVTSRTAEDVDEAVLSFAQVKAMASGNPIIMEKAKLDADYNALRIQHKGHEQKQSQIYFQIGQTETKLMRLPLNIDNIERDLTNIDLQAPVKIDGIATVDEALINKSLRKLLKYDELVVTIGSFKVEGDRWSFDRKLNLVGSHRYHLEHPNFETVRGILSKGIAEALVNEKQKLNQVKQDLGSLKASLGKPFEHLEKMQSIRSRLKEIDTILQKEQDSKEITSYSTYTECADYISPEPEIIAELRLLDHRPQWMEDMLNLLPSNVIEFPVHKQITKPHIVSVEYKYEAVKTRRGEELSHLQGCLF
jgi:N12 class adenine-specific DNA methylase